jgi:pyruvate dehydrogenase E1 component alpha subunit
MHPESVHEAVERAVRRAREGGGPTLLEMKTYRYKGHSISDPQKYRTKEEVESYKEKDPIAQILATIQNEKLATEEELEAIHNRVDALVEDSVRFAEESPWPDDNEVLKDVYAVDEPHFFVTD